MLAMICLFEHLPAAIVGLCSMICMGVQIITKSQIPEVKLFPTQCKVHIVWDLCDFLLLSVILWLFIAKPGKNGWQAKDDSCFLKLAPALMDNDTFRNAARTLCASELSRSSRSRGWHVKIKANYEE